MPSITNAANAGGMPRPDRAYPGATVGTSSGEGSGTGAIAVLPPRGSTGQPAAAPPAQDRRERRRPDVLTAAGLAVVLVGVFLPMVDFFIVNVALPTIDRDLHASAPLLELVISAYATAYALLLVVGGRLG